MTFLVVILFLHVCGFFLLSLYFVTKCSRAEVERDHLKWIVEDLIIWPGPGPQHDETVVKAKQLVGMSTGAFYEDDEAVEDVVAAFDAAEKGLTGKPLVGTSTPGYTVVVDPTRPCESCDGDGIDGRWTCDECNGSGSYTTIAWQS